MKKIKSQFTSVSLSILALSACGTAKEPATAANSYRTTSNIGDLSTWTIDGNNLSVEWKDVAPITGAIEKIYSVNAICGTIDPEFGNRTCLVDGDSLCTDGTEACAPGDGPQNGETFTIFEVPGVALIASVEDTDLHAGFALGGCADTTTDDYTYVNIGLGQEDIFGLFRTDSTFATIEHLEFGFTDDPVNQISYTTGDGGTGVVSGVTASACTDGVSDLVIDASSDTMRVILTAAGHFIIDKPEGQGGLVAVNGQNVASIEDFANKNFGGITFPDDRAPELVSIVTGPVSGGRVQVLSIELSTSGDITPETAVYINDSATGSKLNAELLEPKNPYANNQIVADGSYGAGPSSLPGVFEIDPVSGDETAIIGVGATVDGQTLLFGSVVNQFDGVANAVKGNFILVEK